MSRKTRCEARLSARWPSSTRSRGASSPSASSRSCRLSTALSSSGSCRQRDRRQLRRAAAAQRDLWKCRRTLSIASWGKRRPTRRRTAQAVEVLGLEHPTLPARCHREHAAPHSQRPAGLPLRALPLRALLPLSLLPRDLLAHPATLRLATRGSHRATTNGAISSRATQEGRQGAQPRRAQHPHPCLLERPSRCPRALHQCQRLSG